MQWEGQGDGRWGTGGLLGDIRAMAPPWPCLPPGPVTLPVPRLGKHGPAPAETPSPYLCRRHGGAGRAASRPRRCPAAAAGRRAGGQPAAACAHGEPPSSPSRHHGAAAFSCEGRKLGKCRGWPWGGTRELSHSQAHFWKLPQVHPGPHGLVRCPPRVPWRGGWQGWLLPGQDKETLLALLVHVLHCSSSDTHPPAVLSALLSPTVEGF